jgi:mono/diheme cytochrome c family protein
MGVFSRLFSILILLAAFAGGRAVAQPIFTPDQVARGAGLAKLGACAVCHTAPGGQPYAGGGAVPTPFGRMYGSNITPDADTGIGRWSLEDFDHALRQGLRRDGKTLYPAMPYDHYAGLTDGDVAALYAFFMTRRAVRATPPETQLIFPLGWRPFAWAWKLLFFHPKPPPPGRGAYLVQTLGHCAACHGPHGLLGEEQTARGMAGGWAEGWFAPPLNAASPASGAWTADRLYAYLRTGLDPSHAAAAGPMGPVAHELAAAPDADVRAIAAYVAGLMGAKPSAPPAIDRAAAAASANPRGAALFEGACAPCHAPGAPMVQAGRPALHKGSPLWEDDPRDTLKIMMDGLQPPVGEPGPFMPAFADTLRDDDLGEIAGYMRARFTDRAPWGDPIKAAAKARAAR